MKTLKPQTSSFLSRPFEVDHKFFCALTAIAYVPFENPRSLRHEVALWKAVGQHLGETPLDAAITKSRAEVLVAGDACALGGDRTVATSVKLVVSRGDKRLVDKELHVVGDRVWEVSGMTAPQPFERMPVSWARAFGGEGFEANPHGRGLRPTVVDGKKVHALPNVEHPKKRVTSASDKPEPAGFGPLDITHPARMKLVGTYDGKWLETRYPGPPADFHWEHHNVAPDDQRLKGYFEGNETIRVEGMHPAHRVLEMSLPPLVAKFFVLRKGKEVDLDFEEHTGRLDTVFAFPTEGGVALFYRAAIPCTEDDADDVHTTLVAFEEAGRPKDKAHYKEALRARMDPEKGLYAILNDGDLLPDWPVDAKDALAEALGPEMKEFEMEGLQLERAERRIDKELAEMRAALAARGEDTSSVEKKMEEIAQARADKPPSAYEKLGPYLARKEEEANEARRRAEESKREAEAQARERLEALGVDYDKLRADSKRKTGPPDCFADRILERMRDLATLIKNAGGSVATLEAQLADPEHEQRLRDAEHRLLQGYRIAAHMLDPIEAEHLGRDLRLERRKELEEALRRGARLGSIDLTGADLSGMNLAGAKLEGALLEDAILRGADLSGANLASAVLTRADLSEANLTGAHLEGANLGGARFDGADLTKATLDGVILIKARLRHARLDGAKIVRCHMGEIDLEHASLAGAQAKGLMVSEGRFDHASFEGADLVEAMFVKCSFEQTSFARAKMAKASLVESAGERCSFAGTDLRGTRVVLATKLDRSDFKGALLGNTLLRGTSLVEADFTEVDASNCDLSEADLTGGKLRKLVAKSSLFIRTQLAGADLRGAVLMNACLQKARLAGADLRGANLFRADFARAVGDDRTRLDGAHVVEVRTVPDPSKRRLFS